MEAQRDLIISTLDIMKFNMRMLEEENEKLKKENKDKEEQSEELCDIIEKLKEEKISPTDYERVLAEKEDYKKRYFDLKEENKELQDKLDFIKKVKEDYFKTIKWKNDMIVDLENDKRSLLKKIQRLEQTISNHEEDMKYFSKKD